MYTELNDRHRLIYTCSKCNGTDIHFDAMLSWDEDAQQFEVISVADSVIVCMGCHEDVEPNKAWIECPTS